MKSKMYILILLVFFGLDYICAQTWESFTAENSGLPDNMVSSITISADGTVWFATDNGLASYKEGTWKSFKTENGLSSNKLNSVAFLPVNSQKLWVASDLGAAVFNAESNNDITDPQYITKTADNIVSDSITAMDIDGSSSNWIGTEKGLSVITNSGLYNFTEKNGFKHSKINALKVLTTNWVHIATEGGGVSRLKYNGVDGITSATQIETAWSALPSDTVLAVYVTDDTLYWYGTTAGVATFHGEDSKVHIVDGVPTNWWIYNTFTSDIINDYVQAITRDNGRNMWFGTKDGLSRLSSDKSTWQSFSESDGLISNNILDLKVDTNNDLWIATDKGVSHVTDLPTSVQSDGAINYKFELANYPNPFNPETKIDYTIPKASRVKVEVFDILGRRVNTLVDKKQNAGRYQVMFNANNIPSGIYIYRLTTEQSSMTKKMVLLK